MPWNALCPSGKSPRSPSLLEKLFKTLSRPCSNVASAVPSLTPLERTGYPLGFRALFSDYFLIILFFGHATWHAGS